LNMFVCLSSFLLFACFPAPAVSPVPARPCHRSRCRPRSVCVTDPGSAVSPVPVPTPQTLSFADARTWCTSSRNRFCCRTSLEKHIILDSCDDRSEIRRADIVTRAALHCIASILTRMLSSDFRYMHWYDIEWSVTVTQPGTKLSKSDKNIVGMLLKILNCRNPMADYLGSSLQNVLQRKWQDSDKVPDVSSYLARASHNLPKLLANAPHRV
jgi:hypothetical protein